MTSAYEHALRAEALDPDDQIVQVILGRIEQYRRDFERAGARLERARCLAPNDAFALIQLSLCFRFQGEPELAGNSRSAPSISARCVRVGIFIAPRRRFSFCGATTRLSGLAGKGGLTRR